MSKLKKAIERSMAERQEPAPFSGMSDREQLEHEIRQLLSNECPEMLGTMKKQIRLSYSKTITIKADMENLLRNHVYAIMQDIEITKQIEILRAQVLDKLKKMNANCLMVASANHREGKTFISTNLAISIAQNLDRTVMLVDADLRNRSYKQCNMGSIFFNSRNKAGLSDYLSGGASIEDLLVNPGIPRLTVLPSGKALPDSTSFLGSPKMEALIDEMKSRYSKERILIFDCSSFLSNADPLVLSRFVDAVLLVVENERTEIDALRRVIELLKDRQILGIVMNKTKGSN